MQHFIWATGDNMRQKQTSNYLSHQVEIVACRKETMNSLVVIIDIELFYYD